MSSADFVWIARFVAAAAEQLNARNLSEIFGLVTETRTACLFTSNLPPP